MTSDWLGGGLIIAIAAGLWLIYFMPAWSRRREYLATERNAVRLQQTLRILAETAEVPDEIRAETTARSVAEHERYLKRQTDLQIPEAVLLAGRIRRSRAFATALLFVSMIVMVLAAMQISLAGAWAVVVMGATISVVSVWALGRLAKTGRKLRLPVPAQSRRATEFVDHSADFEEAIEEAPAVREATPWTPIPLPKPLYAPRVTAPGLSVASPSIAREVTLEAEADARRAAQDAERALRAAVAAAAAGPGVDPVPLRAAAQDSDVVVAAATGQMAEAAPPSRFAAMGIVDPNETGSINLDEVLARRRAG
jgi:hypothetical protein